MTTPTAPAAELPVQHPRAGTRRRTQAEPAPISARASGRAPPQIADHNLRVTLEAIRRDGPLTRLELGRRSGLTAPGITNILRRLSQDGLVTARQRSDRGPGQPSMEFALNPDGAFALGLRLHDARSEAVLVDLSGAVRQSQRFEPAGDLAATIKRLLPKLTAGIPGAKILGVGIGTSTPGAADVRTLNAALSPCRVMVERDCVTAALAERTLGIGIVEGGLALIVIDDTVRAGLLLQGAPLGGVHGRAGGIGAMRTGADRVPLDSVAGLGALRTRLGGEAAQLLVPGEDLPMTPAVRAWIKDAASHLLDAIVAMTGFVAPGAILIGGDLPRNAIDALIAQMAIERGDTTIRPFSTPWSSPIRAASFASGGIALGAALLPFFDTVLPSPMAAA